MEIMRLGILARPVFAFVLTIALRSSTEAQESAKPKKPETEGQPVFIIAGKVVTFPKGMEQPPEDYKGSFPNAPVLAVIKIDGKIVGEIYASPLPKTAEEEANELAESKVGKLLERKSIEVQKQKVEVVTRRLDANSKVGTPWVLHSLYFPKGGNSVTFKLIASEARFKELLPYLETMLSLHEDGKGEK
jgi:hypothetical protein